MTASMPVKSEWKEQTLDILTSVSSKDESVKSDGSPIAHQYEIMNLTTLDAERKKHTNDFARIPFAFPHLEEYKNE